MHSNNNFVKIKTNKFPKPKRVKISNLTARRVAGKTKRRTQDRMLGFGQTS